MQGMNVYSWNVLYENKELERAFDFIRTANFDLFCLQEVPDVFLERLKTLPYHVASAVEYDFVRRDSVHRQTLSVLLSRYPIAAAANITVPNWFEKPILRERITTAILRFFHIWQWTRTSGNRNHLLARVDIPDVGSVQVVSAHLTIHGSSARRSELNTIFSALSTELPILIGADLNIFDTYFVSIPSWFFGATLTDALFPWKERAWAEKFFTKHMLVNPLQKRITHRAAQTQLDHILVSNTLKVKSASVTPVRYGSDHNPVHVELS
ncbi:MAG: hypothetical protein JWL82_572 [Parcubacteria group bacterium]|nr:hypothetical protein [Parcubacteria group bacterium]